jgi:hypothetical protein
VVVAVELMDNTHHNQLVQLVAEVHVVLTQEQAVAVAQVAQVDMHSAHTIITTGIFVQDTLHTLQLEMKVHQLVDKGSQQTALPIKVAAVAMEVQDFTASAEAEVAQAIMAQEMELTVEEMAVTLQTMAELDVTELRELTAQAVAVVEQTMAVHQDVVEMEHALLHIG